MMETLKQMVIEGNLDGSVKQVKKLLDEGMDAELIMKDALIAAMDEVGNLFQKGEYCLPEMMIAARAMQSGLDVIQHLLTQSASQPAGRIVMGTVSGDLHDIGKNLVIMSLKGAGYEVVDLGIDVAPEKFAQAIREYKPDLVGLSALLTTTMLSMEKTVKAIQEADSQGKVKIMIGGAPLTQKYADEIGADFYGVNATAGKDYAREVIEQKNGE